MKNLFCKGLMALAAVLCSLTLSATDIESLKDYIPMDATLICQCKNIGGFYQSRLITELAKTQGVDIKAELAKENWKEEDTKGIYMIAWAYLSGIEPNIEMEICVIYCGTQAQIEKSFTSACKELENNKDANNNQEVIVSRTKIENKDAVSFAFNGIKQGILINGAVVKAAPDMIQVMISIGKKGKAYSSLLKPAKSPSTLVRKFLKNCNLCFVTDCHRLMKGFGIDVNEPPAAQKNDPQAPVQPNYKKELQTIAIGFDEVNNNLNILAQLCFLTGSTANSFADLMNQSKLAVMEQPLTGEFAKATTIKNDMNNVNLTFSMPVDKVVGLMVGLMPSQNTPQPIEVEAEGQPAPAAEKPTPAPAK